MKISKKEKEITRQKLIASAVKLFKKKGFRGATMREIAKDTGVADPTIYKYFPSKEEFLYAYFEIKLYETRDKVEAIPDINKFTFREKFQVFIETSLEIYEPDRSFIKLAYEHVFSTNWMGSIRKTRIAQDEFFGMLETWMTQAVEAGEFADPPFRNLLQGLLWDYKLALTYYWLNDKSDQHLLTTQLIDRSLDLLMAALHSDILARAGDLGRFLIREHVLIPLFKKPTWFNSWAQTAKARGAEK